MPLVKVFDHAWVRFFQKKHLPDFKPVEESVDNVEETSEFESYDDESESFEDEQEEDGDAVDSYSDVDYEDTTTPRKVHPLTTMSSDSQTLSNNTGNRTGRSKKRKNPRSNTVSHPRDKSA